MTPYLSMVQTLLSKPIRLLLILFVWRQLGYIFCALRNLLTASSYFSFDLDGYPNALLAVSLQNGSIQYTTK